MNSVYGFLACFSHRNLHYRAQFKTHTKKHKRK